jgi:hypothetical protein
MNWYRTVFISSMVALSAQPALCENIDAGKPSTIVSAIQEIGYKAKLSKDKDGIPTIDTSMNGSKISIDFENCTKNVCRTINAFDIWTIEADQYSSMRSVVDDWNDRVFFSKANASEEYISISYSIDLSQGGMSFELFKSNYDRWSLEHSLFIDKFQREIAKMSSK